MIIPVVAPQLDGNAEERFEALGGKQIQLFPIRKNAAVLEQNYPADLGNDIRQMVRNNQYAGAGPRQLSKQRAQYVRFFHTTLSCSTHPR